MKKIKNALVPAALTSLVFMSSSVLAQVTTPATVTPGTPAAAATAAPAPVVIPSDADLAPLISYLSNYKYQMKEAKTIFHWFQSSDPFIKIKFGTAFSGNLSATDALGLQYVQGMSRRYFNYTDPSDPGAGNMYGPGLYAAVDPVATRSYGGSGTDWVLVQIRLPVGFTLFDLERDGGDTPPADPSFFNALDKAGCPAPWEYSNGMMNNLFNPMTHKNPSCTATIEHIFRDKLQIDGFFYTYGHTNFKACQLPADPVAGTIALDPPFRGGAFVVTNGSKFQASDIRIFNNNTTDDLQDRTDIESSFYQADNDGGYGYSLPPVTPQMIATQFPQYAGWTISTNYMSCAGSPCPPYVWIVSVCSPTPPTAPVATTTTPATPPTVAPVVNQCQTITVVPPPIVPSSTMSLANPPRSGNSCYGAACVPALLWKDLDGVAVDPNLDSYMKANYYGCSGKPDYL